MDLANNAIDQGRIKQLAQRCEGPEQQGITPAGEATAQRIIAQAGVAQAT